MTRKKDEHTPHDPHEPLVSHRPAHPHPAPPDPAPPMVPPEPSPEPEPPPVTQAAPPPPPPPPPSAHAQELAAVRAALAAADNLNHLKLALLCLVDLLARR